MPTFDEMLYGSPIACPERLDRSVLNYTLGSLHRIDAYLRQVRRRVDDLEGVMFLDTALAIARYVSEVIRRNPSEGGLRHARHLVRRYQSGTALEFRNVVDVVLRILLRPAKSDRLPWLESLAGEIAKENDHCAFDSVYEFAACAMTARGVSACPSGRDGTAM